MENLQIIKGNHPKRKIDLHAAICDVERFLRDYKIENVSKWKPFKNVLKHRINKARK